MESWRDSASTQAQRDLDELLNAALFFAKEQLDKRGTFFPFGALVTGEGEVRLTAADAGKQRPPDPQALLDQLYETAQADRDAQRAVAFAADVKLGTADAVYLELEHSEGVALTVTVPYRRSKQRALSFAKPVAAPGTARVW